MQSKMYPPLQNPGENTVIDSTYTAIDQLSTTIMNLVQYHRTAS